MRIQWVIAGTDKSAYRAFVQQWREHPFVLKRETRNVERTNIDLTKPSVWKALVVCLLTTQQRTGAGSAIEKLLEAGHRLLDVEACIEDANLAQTAQAELTELRFRRSGRIADEIAHAALQVNSKQWGTLVAHLSSLLAGTTVPKERVVARYLQEHFKGIGPKQSRNLIQSIGLSQHEIPLDSRLMKVLRDLAFPVPLSPLALGDENYYCFVEDGLQEILSEIDVLPCIFDACAFASKERILQQRLPGDGLRPDRIAQRLK